MFGLNGAQPRFLEGLCTACHPWKLRPHNFRWKCEISPRGVFSPVVGENNNVGVAFTPSCLSWRVTIPRYFCPWHPQRGQWPYTRAAPSAGPSASPFRAPDIVRAVVDGPVSRLTAPLTQEIVWSWSMTCVRCPGTTVCSSRMCIVAYLWSLKDCRCESSGDSVALDQHTHICRRIITPFMHSRNHLRLVRDLL